MEKTDDIDTNRPSFMFSPLVLPRGSIQVENGTVYQHIPHGVTYFDIPETQVRVGWSRRAEFQMFVPMFVLIDRSDRQLNAASNLNEVGIKYQLPAIKKFQPTVIAALNIPTGNRVILGPGVQPVFRAPWGYPIGKWSIMGMQSLLVLNSGRDVQYQPDFMLVRSITPRLNAFVEYLGVFTHHARGVSLIHFGSTWKVARHHQLDVHWGFGLNRTAPAAFVGAGYSYRFDWLPWGWPRKKSEQ